MTTTTSTTMQTRAGPLADLEREIVAMRRELHEMWRAAPTADRIFAVDRLLRADVLAPDVEEQVRTVQDRVRDRWVTARVTTTMHGVHADARVAGLQLMLVEQRRDGLLQHLGLFDLLFSVAEGYLRAVPLVAGERTFKDLLRARDVERARLVPILAPVEDA
jgi:hypothetical protein